MPARPHGEDRSMSEPDAIDRVAREIVGDLDQLEPEAREAFRYLWAAVAHREGLLEIVSIELRESGTREIYREPSSAKLYAVTRPATWTEASRGIHQRNALPVAWGTRSLDGACTRIRN